MWQSQGVPYASREAPKNHGLNLNGYHKTLVEKLHNRKFLVQFLQHFQQ